MIIRLRTASLAVLPFLVMPALAYAHMPIKGMANFYNGLLHPVLVPAHILLLVAAGLHFGQQGINENKIPILVFLVATVLGMISSVFSAGSNFNVILLAGATIIGLLVATNLRLSVYWCAIIGALAGFVIGLDSAQETLLGRDKFVALSGSAVGIYLLMLYPMGFADYFNKKPWQRVGVRIIGSWLAATSFLVLSLSLSPVKT
jgi:hydrogenase/urease accessory protein HupE